MSARFCLVPLHHMFFHHPPSSTILSRDTNEHMVPSRVYMCVPMLGYIDALPLIFIVAAISPSPLIVTYQVHYLSCTFLVIRVILSLTCQRYFHRYCQPYSNRRCQRFCHGHYHHQSMYRHRHCCYFFSDIDPHLHCYHRYYCLSAGASAAAPTNSTVTGRRRAASPAQETLPRSAERARLPACGASTDRVGHRASESKSEFGFEIEPKLKFVVAHPASSRNLF